MNAKLATSHADRRFRMKKLEDCLVDVAKQVEDLSKPMCIPKYNSERPLNELSSRIEALNSQHEKSTKEIIQHLDTQVQDDKHKIKELKKNLVETYENFTTTEYQMRRVYTEAKENNELIEDHLESIRNIEAALHLHKSTWQTAVQEYATNFGFILLQYIVSVVLLCIMFTSKIVTFGTGNPMLGLVGLTLLFTLLIIEWFDYV
eukprot:m.83175 g.83175  ORF g.83175 m.83175 type:complete len:204 (+) comp21103_c0_seq5:224-835(+)